MIAANPAASGSSLSPELRAALLVRLEPLDARDRTLLRSAAVIGRSFDLEVLSAASGREIAEIRPALERACDLQLVEADPEVSGRYWFRHALTREAIYSELLARHLRPLHRAIGSVLEGAAAAGAPAKVDELAYHWWSAGDRKRGSRYCEEAGDRAGALHAHEQALEYYGRALTLLDGRTRAYARIATKIRRIHVYRSTA
jgi:predicted ATPase